MDAAVPLMSIEELAARTDVRVRTVRFYVAEGLLPGPGARGRAAAYGEEHLLRLRLIRRLADRRVPLAEMKARLGGLTLDQVRALLDEEDRTAAALASQADSDGAYVGTLLKRPPIVPSPPAAPAAPAAPAVAPETSHSINAPASGGAPASIREAPPAPGAAPGEVLEGVRGPSPGSPVALWQRWVLAPGVELHVRQDASVRHAPLIRRLRQAAAVANALTEERSSTGVADGISEGPAPDAARRERPEE